MRQTLREQGWVVLKGVVDAARVEAANRAIDQDLATRFDPARMEAYTHVSACPELRGDPVVADLLEAPALKAALQRVLDLDRMRWGAGQIAVRWPGQCAPDRRIEPHIDGVSTGRNGVVGPMLHSFTALVGVFLTPSHGPFSGNFTVWPGSLEALRDWFRDRGRRGLVSGMPDVDIRSLSEPIQLEVEPGDAVIANYLLLHANAGNASPHRRHAVFWRLGCRGLAWHRYASLTAPWRDWR
jgi:hypothetical protein